MSCHFLYLCTFGPLKPLQFWWCWFSSFAMSDWMRNWCFSILFGGCTFDSTFSYPEDFNFHHLSCLTWWRIDGFQNLFDFLSLSVYIFNSHGDFYFHHLPWLTGWGIGVSPYCLVVVPLTAPSVILKISIFTTYHVWLDEELMVFKIFLVFYLWVYISSILMEISIFIICHDWLDEESLVLSDYTIDLWQPLILLLHFWASHGF